MILYLLVGLRVGEVGVLANSGQPSWPMGAIISTMEVVIPITLILSAGAVGVQLRRVLNNHVLGVSAATWGTISIINIGWATFFFLEPPSRPWASIVMIAYAAMSFTIVAKVPSKNKINHLIMLAGWLVGWLVIASVTIVSVSTGVTLFAAIGAFMYAPQTLVAIKGLMNNTSLDGVSKLAWSWSVLVSVAWLATAIHLQTIPAILANAFSTVCGIIIVVCLILKRRVEKEEKTQKLLDNESGVSDPVS